MFCCHISAAREAGWLTESWSFLTTLFAGIEIPEF